MNKYFANFRITNPLPLTDCTTTTPDVAPIVLDETQQSICDLILSKPERNFFISGEAGTGKSQLIKGLSVALKNCMILTPTGVAASIINGRTINSGFGIGFLKDYVANDHLSPKTILALEGVRTLIFDEISMISGRMLTTVDHMIRQSLDNPSQSFGGKQIVLIGDFFQLPPVSLGKEFFFSHEDYIAGRNAIIDGWAFGHFDEKKSQLVLTSTWLELNLLCFELTKNYRFQHMNENDIELFRRLRVGNDVARSIELLLEKTKNCEHDPESTLTIVCTNAEKARINAYYFQQLKSETLKFTAEYVFFKKSCYII